MKPDLPNVPCDWRAEQDKDLKDFNSYQYQVESNLQYLTRPGGRWDIWR